MGKLLRHFTTVHINPFLFILPSNSITQPTHTITTTRMVTSRPRFLPPLLALVLRICLTASVKTCRSTSPQLLTTLASSPLSSTPHTT